MEKKTIDSRLDRPSVQVPNLKTSDGVKWSKVVIVARQLGGVVIKTRGNHPYEIIFPNQDRPIPLSKDVNTISLAKEIRIQLFKSIPEHKIPKMTKLRQAINSGDVHKLELD
jgi:hypothetical protein